MMHDLLEGRRARTGAGFLRHLGSFPFSLRAARGGESWRRRGDFLLEVRIALTHHALLAAATSQARRDAWRSMKKLIAKRSAEQIAKMESMRGLA